MSGPALVQASRRLATHYAPGLWVGAIRPAFDAGQVVFEQHIDVYPAHFLVALWEPPAAGVPMLSRWPSVAAIASPDAPAALIELVSHLPAGARAWLASEGVDWALIADIVRLSDRNLQPYHHQELQAFIGRCRARDAETIRQTYSDEDPGFEALKSRLLTPGRPDA
ncbi:hypothetical protein OOT46_27390 [Aquabacterium sp. A7-Y]|uniref:hypothetical protein n=1 Tax=Aquabacterium sp. A7-Y TaxID=1349605 RepID=UPI00223E2803|nr:hypothetical protein [Aquabacterium sp. A7-Y]MCW7541535.1 hypothetical protein [Aquabacterium sp. A7-Y]